MRTMKSTLVEAAESHSVTRRGHLKSWNQHQWAQSNPTPTSFLLLYNWFILDATVIGSNSQQAAPFSSHCPHLNWEPSNLSGADHSLLLLNFFTCRVFPPASPLLCHFTYTQQLATRVLQCGVFLHPPPKRVQQCRSREDTSLSASIQGLCKVAVSNLRLQLVLCGNVGETTGSGWCSLSGATLISDRCAAAVRKADLAAAQSACASRVDRRPGCLSNYLDKTPSGSNMWTRIACIREPWNIRRSRHRANMGM